MKVTTIVHACRVSYRHGRFFSRLFEIIRIFENFVKELSVVMSKAAWNIYNMPAEDLERLAKKARHRKKYYRMMERKNEKRK